MRTALVLTAFLVALLAPKARAMSCAEAIEVGERTLWLAGSDERRLPPSDGDLDAVIPACGEGDDEPIVAMRLRGVPPDVAALYRGRLFLADGSLPVVRGHPLNRVVAFKTRGRCRRVRPPLEGRAEETMTIGFGLRTGDRVHWLLTDRRTRIVNRPAHQPLNLGQRLRVSTSRCAKRVFADRITFVGQTVEPAEEPDGRSWPLAVVVALIALVAAGALTRRPRHD